MPALPIQQADLILKLYELRRETVMRELLRRRRVPSLLGPTGRDRHRRRSPGRVRPAGLRLLGHGRRLRSPWRPRCLPRLRHLPGNVLPVRQNPAVSARFPPPHEPARMDDLAGAPHRGLKARPQTPRRDAEESGCDGETARATELTSSQRRETIESVAPRPPTLIFGHSAS